MLNKFLYDALRASFGSVEVENEGVQADIEPDTGSMYSTAWKLTENGERGEQYRVNCPICKDRKHHLYISYLSYARPVINGQEMAVGPLLAHCFRRNCTDDRANRDNIAAIIGMGMACCGDGTATSVTVDINNGVLEQPVFSTSDAVTEEGIRTWVPDFRFCKNGMSQPIADYLGSRGVDMRTLEQFNIGWGNVKTPRSGTLLNNGVPWIIIPVVMNGKLRGVQARCPDQFVSEDSLRYWIHPGMRKRAIVYNIDSARLLGLGVLCEGVFDVLKVGKPGICCFGHTPSLTQKQLLTSIGNCLIWLPDTDIHEDFDTVEEARKQAAAWNEGNVFPKGAHVVVLPAKDAGEMTRSDIWSEIISQVPSEVQDYIMADIVPKLIN